jgi:hypothetical protein
MIDYIIMKCIPKTSSRMEMITMDISNTHTSNEVTSTFQSSVVDLNNSEDHLPPSNTFSTRNINFNNCSSLCEKISPYISSIKEFIVENFNTIYGNFLHIYFIIVFEILFYFNYIINIEYGEIKRVLKSFADDLKLYLGDIIDSIPNNQDDVFDRMCNTLNMNYLYKNNEKLKQQAYYIIWSLSICLIIIVIMHYFIVKNLRKLIYKTIEAFVFISFIALFEYYFFTEIITKYNVMTSEEASCLLYEDIF